MNFYDDFGNVYYLEVSDNKEIVKALELQTEKLEQIVENQEELLEAREAIIENQQAVIEQLTISNEAFLESNTVLVNFFFLFMVLMLCKFVHFLFYKVFFGGIT